MRGSASEAKFRNTNEKEHGILPRDLKQINQSGCLPTLGTPDHDAPARHTEPDAQKPQTRPAHKLQQLLPASAKDNKLDRSSAGTQQSPAIPHPQMLAIQNTNSDNESVIVPTPGCILLLLLLLLRASTVVTAPNKF